MSYACQGDAKSRLTDKLHTPSPQDSLFLKMMERFFYASGMRGGRSPWQNRLTEPLDDTLASHAKVLLVYFWVATKFLTGRHIPVDGKRYRNHVKLLATEDGFRAFDNVMREVTNDEFLKLELIQRKHT